MYNVANLPNLLNFCNSRFLLSNQRWHQPPQTVGDFDRAGPFGSSSLEHRTENIPLKDDKRLCKWQCYYVAISYNLVETSYRLKSFLREYGRITKLIYWRNWEFMSPSPPVVQPLFPINHFVVKHMHLTNTDTS